MQCVCGKTMKKAKISLKGFQVDGFQCECGEEVINPWEVEKVRQALQGKVKARKVAHSLVVTLPQALAGLTHIKQGDTLHWIVSNNQLILEKT